MSATTLVRVAPSRVSTIVLTCATVTRSRRPGAVTTRNATSVPRILVDPARRGTTRTVLTTVCCPSLFRDYAFYGQRLDEHVGIDVRSRRDARQPFRQEKPGHEDQRQCDRRKCRLRLEGKPTPNFSIIRRFGLDLSAHRKRSPRRRTVSVFVPHVGSATDVAGGRLGKMAMLDGRTWD